MKQIAMRTLELRKMTHWVVINDKANKYIPNATIIASHRQIDVRRVLDVQKYGNYVWKRNVKLKKKKILSPGELVIV